MLQASPASVNLLFEFFVQLLTAIGEYRNALPDFLYFIQIDFCITNAFLFLHIQTNFSPGGDHHRAAAEFIVWITADTVRGDNKNLVFDGACLQQDAPMINPRDRKSVVQGER